MQNALDAYTQTAKVTIAPRQLEASLLLKAAAQMQNLYDNWSEDESELDAVVLYNRRLWSVLVTAVTEEDNPLPKEIKNNIASLGVFIFKHSLDLTIEREPEKLLPLININKELAAGLNAEAKAA